MVFELKKDTYKAARGKYSRIIDLHCRICGNKIATYQKDGPGNLRRLYLDRIIEPKKLPKNKITCSRCEEDIGTIYVYKKENRKAFKLYQDALVKKN